MMQEIKNKGRELVEYLFTNPTEYLGKIISDGTVSFLANGKVGAAAIRTGRFTDITRRYNVEV